ncbi:hypothetical protein BDZ94DRAFT_1157821 [Collybia nuda]|uniref:Arrestin-like N-terminal domain-containing protein n=1 Tax=Collybia nuda TaxID=64659 RepID=A0A9P6CN68_9AGAR|nr:hypothetical protein BDZ94DRAFT_1157821 [Collybia nuda]
MDVAPPPRYRRFSTRPGQVPQSGNELPIYTRRNTLAQPVIQREPTEHVYLLTEKNRAWVTLKIQSSAKSSKSLPTFFEKENINGSLEINADKGDSIHSITATVTGRIITGSGADDIFTFLSQSLPIWSKSADVPRLPSSSVGTSQSKLLGHCVWPLSIPIPKTVVAPSGTGDMQPFRLPETFLERHTSASVQYDFTIVISRGKLRSDSQIKTAFGYVPSSRPEPPSMLRQLAYQQNTPLPSPHHDPQGWKTLRPVSARGILYKSHQVEVQCTLSLPKPLCYTRGSVIPCFLTIDGQNSDTLDLFSTPSAIVVALHRRVRFFSKTSLARQEVSWNETIEEMGTAVWWPCMSLSSSAHSRHFEGEVKLPKDLRPTSAMGHFSISYSLVLRPFNVVHLVSDSRSLLSEPVEIATMHSKGPRPQAYAPPAYDTTPAIRPHDRYVALSAGAQGW